MFTRANPLGWALDEELTSAQMNAVDADHVNALDGKDGGAYVLSQPLALRPGDGLGSGGDATTVPIPLVVVGGKMTSSSGGYALAVLGGEGTRPGPGAQFDGAQSGAGNVFDQSVDGVGARANGSPSGPSGIGGGTAFRGRGGNSTVASTLGGVGAEGVGGDNFVGSGGYGVTGKGGTGSDNAHGGSGGRLEGTGAGHGAIGVGGVAGGDGLQGIAVGGNGRGVFGRGWGGGAGVAGEGGPGSNAGGVLGAGDGTGAGVLGLGGGFGTTAFGLIGVSENIGSGGVWGIAHDGDNIQGGLVGWGCVLGGDGGYGAVLKGSASRAPLRLIAGTPSISSGSSGTGCDIWTDGVDLFVKIAGVEKKVAWQ